MTASKSTLKRKSAGFTLPAILVVVGALLILAVGVLLITGIERGTARSFVDFQRAELAAQAGLEEVRGVLGLEASNDDYLIVSGTVPLAANSTKESIPYLYLARGSGGAGELSYRYLPLFSSASQPQPGAVLEAPAPDELIGPVTREIPTLPWYEKANVAWIGLANADNKMVARYAYWVEDLQGKVNPRVAGNELGSTGQHARSAFPNPPAKPLKEDEPPLSAVAVHVLDPMSGDTPAGDLMKKLIEGRPAMVSPDSVLGAINLAAPLERSPTTGLLEDPVAAALERSASPVVQAYREMAVVPFAPGLSKDVVGKPKLNLNKLLEGPRGAAVNEFASWINRGLPDFNSPGADGRKGGFPDDYLKTLAANALDYADDDNEPSVEPGVYRGLDGYPLLSEIALKVQYTGRSVKDGRLFLNWRLKLFGEFWNMSNVRVTGKAALSYEVALNHSPIGEGVAGIPFDDPDLLRDPERSTHKLTFRNGRFYGPDVDVVLDADEYKYYEFADVICSIEVGPNNISYATKFLLEEKASDARGVSVIWNSVETERTEKIVRDLGDPNAKYMEFTILNTKTVGKAGLPGAGYGPYGEFTNNMGDPRISHYIRGLRLSENSLRNLSPNRRNVRRGTIYDSDSATKPSHYGRVLPSEWPDGGQDSPIGSFTVPANSSFGIEPTAGTYLSRPAPLLANAPMRLSNEGRFYSVTELGYVYDPVMWLPTYADLKGVPGSGVTDTNMLRPPNPSGSARMPARRNVWPDVTSASVPSPDYGGGNTLRIGRPEHQRFDKPGLHAAHLLDLFHAGDPNSKDAGERQGETYPVDGHINVNTAGKDALRAMAAGVLRQDPELRRVSTWNHDVSSGRLSPTSIKITVGSPTLTLAADRIAEGIMHSRPFASMRDLSTAMDKADEPVFGNKKMYPQINNLQWTDAAAEEVFARVHDAATLRSRNFRVWVIGQSIAGNINSPEVLAETRKVFTVFADPGERQDDGTIDPTKTRMRVMYENDF